MARKPKHVPAGYKEGGQFYGPKSIRTLLVRLFRGKDTKQAPPPKPLSVRSLVPNSPAVRRLAPRSPHHAPAPDPLDRLPAGEGVYYHAGARELTGERELFLAPDRDSAVGYLQGGAGTVHAARLARAAQMADQDDLRDAATLAHGDIERHWGYRPYDFELADDPDTRRVLARRGFVGARFKDLGPDNLYQHTTVVVWDASVLEPLASVDVSARDLVAPEVRLSAGERQRASRPVALIPPARPRQPRTHKGKKPPRKPTVSDSPKIVKAQLAVKAKSTPKPGPVPRTNERVTDPRTGRLGTVTQLHEDRGQLVVRWDDGRSQTLPITALYPAWRPVRGGDYTGPPVDAATLTRRVREAADQRNSDEMRLLLGRMSDADLAAFARRLGIDKRQLRGLGRDDLVSRVIASLLSEELDQRYAKLLPDSPAVTRMTRRGR